VPIDRRFELAADAVLLVHAAFVLFVIGGWLAIWVGWWRGWRWVRRPLFRGTHLAAIGVVAAQAVLGQICPLTALEEDLRGRAGLRQTYEHSFIQHWVGRFLFFEAEPWVFTTIYVIFFALVVATFWRVPVEWRRRSERSASSQPKPPLQDQTRR
jgi:hypothetical protein